MMGVCAELERAMIGERVNASLARARAKGFKLGRKPVARQIEAAGYARLDGMLKIGRELDIGTSVVQRVLTAAI
jgi:DNA invertase Pin-like site-specific DNA recombinase